MLDKVLGGLIAQYIYKRLVYLRVDLGSREVRRLHERQMGPKQAPVLPHPVLDRFNKIPFQILLTHKVQKGLMGVNGADHSLLGL